MSGRGISAAGLYVPYQRISSEEIESAWGVSPPISYAAVPASDEDSITMAVEASKNALRDEQLTAEELGYIAIGTTTPPLEEEAIAPRVAEALGVDKDAQLISATQSTAAGGIVLRDAMEANVPALAVVADAPVGDPGELGQRIGAGAAAFLFNEDGDVVITDTATKSQDMPGLRYREQADENVQELHITTYERRTTQKLVSGAIEALDVDLSNVASAALHQSTPDIPYRISRDLSLESDAIERGCVVDSIGDAGAATPAIGLVSSLSDCDIDDSCVAAFFGSGSTALALSFDSLGELTINGLEQLDRSKSLSYTDVLRMRGEIGETEVAGGGAHISLPSWQRTLPQRYRLIAGRCPNCGSISFPPEGACPGCRNRVTYESIQLPSSGKVAAVTVIEQGGAPPEFTEQQRRDGPFAVAVIEVAIEGDSVRLPGQIVGCDPNEISIGDVVDGTFRRIYSTEGITRYGLKFKPN